MRLTNNVTNKSERAIFTYIKPVVRVLACVRVLHASNRNV